MRNLAIRLKGCPRCHGDLIPEGDQFGWDWACLQCGYRETLELRREWKGDVGTEAASSGVLIPAA